MYRKRKKMSETLESQKERLMWHWQRKRPVLPSDWASRKLCCWWILNFIYLCIFLKFYLRFSASLFFWYFGEWKTWYIPIETCVWHEIWPVWVKVKWLVAKPTKSWVWSFICIFLANLSTAEMCQIVILYLLCNIISFNGTGMLILVQELPLYVLSTCAKLHWNSF